MGSFSEQIQQEKIKNNSEFANLTKTIQNFIE